MRPAALNLFLLCLLLGNSIISGFAQNAEMGRVPDLKRSRPGGISLGASLGFNSILRQLYDARIHPVNGTVMIEQIPRTSFLISTAISVPIGFTLYGERSKKKKSRRRLVNVDKNIPKGINLIATVNLLTFSDATNGSVFNQKLDGGLGLGKFLCPQLQMALTFEMISVRQPREFVRDQLKGKKVLMNNQALTSLDKSDNDFFQDFYLPSLSVKFIYMLGGSFTRPVARTEG